MEREGKVPDGARLHYIGGQLGSFRAESRELSSGNGQQRRTFRESSIKFSQQWIFVILRGDILIAFNRLRRAWQAVHVFTGSVICPRHDELLLELLFRWTWKWLRSGSAKLVEHGIRYCSVNRGGGSSQRWLCSLQGEGPTPH